MPFWTTCDVFAPGIALGHVTGRLGCLAAGCCYGKPTDVPWADHLHQPAGRRQRRHAARHPAAPDADLRSGRRAADPRSCCWPPSGAAGRSPAARSGPTCSSTPISRFVIEIYRGDPRGDGVRRVSTSQFISLVLAPLSLVMLLWLSRSAAETPQEMQRRRKDGRLTATFAMFASFVIRRCPLEFTRPRRVRRPAARPLSRRRSLDGHSRSQIQKLIADGHVTLDRRERAKPTSPCARASAVTVDLPEAAPATTAARGAAARNPLPGRRPRGAEQAGRHGRASGRRPRVGHAGQRAAASPDRSERHRRRAAAGHRPSARPRHVGRHGRSPRTTRRTRSCPASSTTARSRRNTSRSSGASCRPAAASTRRSAATRRTGRRCRRGRSTRAQRGDAHHPGAPHAGR